MEINKLHAKPLFSEEIAHLEKLKSVVKQAISELENYFCKRCHELSFTIQE
jgi:lipopolysaccharide biosynthesis regulator YciM